jgi:hypothetical protein
MPYSYPAKEMEIIASLREGEPQAGWSGGLSVGEDRLRRAFPEFGRPQLERGQRVAARHKQPNGFKRVDPFALLFGDIGPTVIVTTVHGNSGASRHLLSM